MPPFSSPVADIRSERAAPAKPWRLKMGAAWRMISWRVRAPLLIPGDLGIARTPELLRPSGLKWIITQSTPLRPSGRLLRRKEKSGRPKGRPLHKQIHGQSSRHDQGLIARDGVDSGAVEIQVRGHQFRRSMREPFGKR